MSTNSLKGLTNEDCSIAFEEAVKSANGHFDSAKAIASIKNYGGAVSHLILGTEELVKGLIFKLQSLGVEVSKVNGINMFFSDHIIRHNVAVYFNSLYKILSPFISIVHKRREEIHNPDAKIVYTSLEKAFLSKDEKQIQAAFKDFPGMIDWWLEANSKKNSGFYIDVRGKKIETPMDVNEDDYLYAQTLIVEFKNYFDKFTAYFEKLTDKEIKEFAQTAKDAKFTSQIEKIIEVRKEERKNKNKIIINNPNNTKSNKKE